MLVVSKEEQAIVAKRATCSNAYLTTGKKRIGCPWIAVQAGISGEVVIAIEKQCRAVPVVRPATSQDINYTGPGYSSAGSGLNVEI